MDWLPSVRSESSLYVLRPSLIERRPGVSARPRIASARRAPRGVERAGGSDGVLSQTRHLHAKTPRLAPTGRPPQLMPDPRIRELVLLIPEDASYRKNFKPDEWMPPEVS